MFPCTNKVRPQANTISQQHFTLWGCKTHNKPSWTVTPTIQQNRNLPGSVLGSITSCSYSESDKLLSGQILTGPFSLENRAIAITVPMTNLKRRKVHPWRRSRVVVNSSKGSPYARKWLRLFSCKECMSKMDFFGMLFSEKQCHGITRSTETKIAFKLRKTGIVGSRNLRLSSEICCKIKFWFTNLRQGRKSAGFYADTFRGGSCLRNVWILYLLS